MSSCSMYIIIHAGTTKSHLTPVEYCCWLAGWFVKKRNKKQFPPPQGLKGRKEIDEEDRPDLIHAMSIPGGPDNRILEIRTETGDLE